MYSQQQVLKSRCFLSKNLLFRPPGATHQAGLSRPFSVVLQVGFSLVSWHCRWTYQQERMPPTRQLKHPPKKNKVKNKSVGPRQGEWWAQIPNLFKPKLLPSSPSSFFNFFFHLLFFRFFCICVYFPIFPACAGQGEKNRELRTGAWPSLQKMWRVDRTFLFLVGGLNLEQAR